MTSAISLFSSLPEDTLTYGIVPNLPLSSRGAFRQTCKAMSQLPEPDLLPLLKRHIPEFEKMDPNDLDAYKRRWVVQSNMRKGVCSIKTFNLPTVYDSIFEVRYDYENKSIQFYFPETKQTSEWISWDPELINTCDCTINEFYAVTIQDYSIHIWDRKLKTMLVHRNVLKKSFTKPLLQGNLLFLKIGSYELQIWDLATKSYSTKLKIPGYLFSPNLFFKGEKLIVSDYQISQILNFAASDIEVLEEIKSNLLSKKKRLVENAELRFNQLPPKYTQSIKCIQNEIGKTIWKDLTFHGKNSEPLRLFFAINYYFNQIQQK